MPVGNQLPNPIAAVRLYNDGGSAGTSSFTEDLIDPDPNQSIDISVETGSAIVYGATADNTTNDSSLRFGRRSDWPPGFVVS